MWDNGTGFVYMTAQDALSTSALLVGLNSGQDYFFQVRARNIYGLGLWSDIAKIRASDVPDTTAIISTISLFDDIIISWVAPPNGGDSISKYDIQLLLPSGSFSVDLTYCDGSD